MKYINIIILSILCVSLKAQVTISFQSVDNLKITADLYYLSNDAPYIVLFHENNGSRAEFREIAPKLTKLGFNCLAVDLRSGVETNFIENETKKEAEQKKLSTDLWEAKKDITASINYAHNKSGKEVIIMGSVSSATQCIYNGINNKKVKAIIAFSAGDYFAEKMDLNRIFSKLDKPIFLAGTKSEEKNIKNLISNTTSNKIKWYCPSKSNGERGCRSLWGTTKENAEYWLALTMFFDFISEK